MSGAGEFLKKGMKRYVEAYNTVKFFQDELKAQLTVALERYSGWTMFAPARPNWLRSAAGGVRNRPWVCVLANGRVAGQEARIEAGLWWAAPKVGIPVVAYVNFHEKPEHLTAFEYRPLDPKISARKIERFTRLYMPASEELDLVGDLRLLLNELQRQAELESRAARK